MKYIEINRLKSFIEKIQEKKERIESNYFNTINIFNDVLKTTTNDNTIAEITNRKQKLDAATNTAINTLDEVERKLKIALVEIEENNNEEVWENFDKVRELANCIDRAASVNATDVYSNRIQNVKELKDAVEYGDISNSFNNSDFHDFEEFNNRLWSKDKSSDDIKEALLNDERYAFESKLNTLEKKLDREIEKLKVQGKTLESHKDAILAAIHNLEVSSLSNANDYGLNKNGKNQNFDLYFASLDKSVNNAVQKLDDVTERVATAISILSSDQVMNLEKISLPLIKSLETSLSNLTVDVTHLRQENKDYRRQIDDFKKVIEMLTKNNREKDVELDSSYKSWLESTRKLNDLEEILLEQSRDIQILDDDKNQIISDLETKIIDTSDFLTQTIHEKEMLMRENEELILTIERIKQEREEEKTIAIDEYVNTVSIQELIEREANKIVEVKITNLVDKYQSEIDKIKSNSIEYLLSNEGNEQFQNNVFDQIINQSEENQVHVLKTTIDKLERQINNLENKIRSNAEIKEKTEDTINDLNRLIGNDPYNMVNVEKSYLSEKFQILENKIEESLNRVADLEDQKAVSEIKKLNEDELNDLFMTSPLYSAIKSELHGMEKEVEHLKVENERIIEENFAINSVLDDTLKKMTLNSSKMKEVEELFTQQEYEFMMLNEEKNNVINTLYSTLKDRDISNMDDLPNLNSLDKYDFNDFARKSLEEKQKLESIDIMDYVKSEVEKIVSNELKFIKNKYDKELENINGKYKKELEKSPSEFLPSDKEEFNEFIANLKEEYIGANLLGENDISSSLENNEKALNSNLNQDNEFNETIDGLDITLNNKTNIWDKEFNEKISDRNVSHVEIKELNVKNKILEKKINEIQNLIQQKSYEQFEIHKNNTFVNNNVVEQTYDYSDFYNQNIFEDLKNSQEQQLKEIELRLENSLGILKTNQSQEIDKLNKKIDNIKLDRINTNESVLDKYFKDDKNNVNKYLEKEILESTDKLLKLQNLLLNLENEITREEKKVITDL